ncbi:hypothetical protein CDD83_4487 [Cordyceps sp. RAO-2017]|nr:hypothetical protein CDD83_4487 [Cordyceps sp. RAO-2017]
MKRLARAGGFFFLPPAVEEEDGRCGPPKQDDGPASESDSQTTTRLLAFSSEGEEAVLVGATDGRTGGTATISKQPERGAGQGPTRDGWMDGGDGCSRDQVPCTEAVPRDEAAMYPRDEAAAYPPQADQVAATSRPPADPPIRLPVPPAPGRGFGDHGWLSVCSRYMGL